MVLTRVSCDNRLVTDSLLHKEQLSLASQLVKQLRKCLNINSEEPHSQRRIVEFTLLLSLVHRKLLPGRLVGTEAGDWILRLSPDALVDETNFADFCTGKWLAEFSLGTVEGDAMRRRLSSLTSKFHQLLNDPCLAGWVHQLVNHKPRWKRIGTSDDNSDPQSASADNLTAQHVPALTQWFTPRWIAQFLVQETIPQDPPPGFTWLDPACGAGHLLVEALRAVADIRSAIAAIHGWDVDPYVLDLARLAIYLTARERCDGELPLPNLDCVDSLSHALSTEQQFDGVATNPPYLSHRLMPAELKKLVRKHYSGAHFDLYACFLKLGSKLTKPGGTMAMICQQSFLSIQRYEKLRAELFQNSELTALAQLGSGTFGNMTGEKVNNAVVVLHLRATERSPAPSGDAWRRPPQSDSMEAPSTLGAPGSSPAPNLGAPGPSPAPNLGAPGSSPAPNLGAPGSSPAPTGKYWQLLNDSERERAELAGLINTESRPFDPREVTTPSPIPFAFLCPPSIIDLFAKYPAVQDPVTEITATNGLFTCNNNLFVKDFREVPPHSADEWVPYDKGGGHKWFRTTPYMVHWKHDGQNIRDYRVRQGQSASLPGERFYRQSGVTYSYIGTQSFRARLLSPDSIFDIASSALFSDRWSTYYLVGWLNSALIRFLLGVLNPTVNFQIGDIRRLPFAMPDPKTLLAVSTASQQAVELAKQIERFDPDSPSYFPQPTNEHDLERINEQERDFQREIDQLIFSLYQITDASQATIYADPWVSRGQRPLCDVGSVIGKLRRAGAIGLQEQLK